MRNSAFLAIAAAAVLACSLTAGAQTVPSMQTSPAKAQDAVMTFFTQDSVGDVQLGRLGLMKSHNASVRTLAQAMVHDHTMTADQGDRVAKSIGDQDVQFKPGDDNVILLTHLSHYSGAQFEKEYISALVDAHKNDIKNANDSLEFATDASVRSYLQTTLRVDHKHLAMAQAIQQKF